MFIIESNVLDQNSSKLKRQENVLEQYKTLSKDQKYYIAEFTTDTIYSKYINTEKFHILYYLALKKMDIFLKYSSIFY
jgi:hypothetical protein